ncbi:MAG: hypothetical protein FD128_1689, partial [Hyphomonadaceae bacterium]
HRGQILKLNSDDYFDIGKHQLKLTGDPESWLLRHEYDSDVFFTKWLEPFWTCFRAKGIVVLAFWVMSLFAEQIRREHKSLGFLETTGIPGTGKSTILMFLWKLTGRSWREEYEGFDPAKSTSAALARNFNRVANLPVVLLEADRSGEASFSKRFDWNELKSLYNGGTFRPRALKNGGNETSEPPFRGAIIIAQNHPIITDDTAIPERILPITFDKNGWSHETKAAADKIEAWPQEELSGNLIHILRREKTWWEQFKAQAPIWEDRFLTPDAFIKNQRIRKNHGQLHAGVEALREIFKLSADQIAAAHDLVDQMAKNRAETLAGDHPVVAKFWDQFDYLESNEAYDPDLGGGKVPINSHRKDKDFIAIHFPHFEARCRDAKITPDPVDILKKHLKDSKSRKFVRADTVNSRNGQSLHCWIFKNPRSDETRGDLL